MPESREEAALAAGWQPHPLLTKRAVSVQWAYPQLHLRVWAMPDGVHVLARTEWMGGDGHLVSHSIARAVWQPPEVTERLVVDWGRRALVKWLEEKLAP